MCIEKIFENIKFPSTCKDCPLKGNYQCGYFPAIINDPKSCGFLKYIIEGVVSIINIENNKLDSQ